MVVIPFQLRNCIPGVRDITTFILVYKLPDGKGPSSNLAKKKIQQQLASVFMQMG